MTRGDTPHEIVVVCIAQVLLLGRLVGIVDFVAVLPGHAAASAGDVPLGRRAKVHDLPLSRLRLGRSRLRRRIVLDATQNQAPGGPRLRARTGANACARAASTPKASVLGASLRACGPQCQRACAGRRAERTDGAAMRAGPISDRVVKPVAPRPRPARERGRVHGQRAKPEFHGQATRAPTHTLPPAPCSRARVNLAHNWTALGPAQARSSSASATTSLLSHRWSCKKEKFPCKGRVSGSCRFQVSFASPAQRRKMRLAPSLALAARLRRDRPQATLLANNDLAMKGFFFGLVRGT